MPRPRALNDELRKEHRKRRKKKKKQIKAELQEKARKSQAYILHSALGKVLEPPF